MKKFKGFIISILLSLIVITAIGIAEVRVFGPVEAQGNPTCPTRPAGDSSNACANTSFVQNAIATSFNIICAITPTTCVSAFGYANIIWWGADSTGIADTVAIFNTAIAAAGIKGLIYFPGGTFRFASALAISQAVEIRCAGTGITTLFTSSTTADLFSVTAGNFNMQDCNLGASVTKSAGTFVNLTSVSQIKLEHIFMNNWFTGISVNGTAGQNFRFRDIYMTSPISASAKGMIVTTGVVDFKFTDSLIEKGAASAQGASGIELSSIGDAVLDGVQIVNMGHCLNIVPTAGNTIQALFVNNSHFDSCSGNAINVSSTGASANVQLLKITSSWAATSVSGLQLATGTGGVITRTELVNTSFVNNSGHGVNISDSGVTNTSLVGGCLGSNVIDGFNAASGVTKFQIQDAKIGPCGQFSVNGTGIVLAGTNSQYLISGNDLTANTAYGINATTPGSGIISNNNTGSNGTAGINGVTPSSTIICTGNVGGTDACSKNNFGVLPSLPLTNTHLLVGNSSGVAADVAMSGDATIANTGAVLFATVNGNVGTFGSATSCVTVTNNAKGLTTAISAATCTPAIGSITGLGTGVATALGTNVGSAGALVTNGGALGTPSSGVATNLTGTAAGLTAGNVTTNANLTGAITSVGNAALLGSFTSANLAAALTDETGSGAAVFGTTPTLATPVINGLPTGTGIATANTASTLVARDGSGNFSAGTITASLTGHASLDCALTGCAFGAISVAPSVNTLAFTNPSITSADTIATFLAANLTNGQRVAYFLGRSQASGDSAYVGFTPNATASLAQLNLGFFGFNNLLNVIANGGVTMPGLGADTASVDATVCRIAATGLLVTGTGALGVCLGTSSARFKHDIVAMGAGLAEITKLTPKNFFYNKGYGDDGHRQQYGFIAEEVVKTIPGVTAPDKDGKPQSVDMLAMVPIIVNAIKQLKADNDNIKAEVEMLKLRRANAK